MCQPYAKSATEKNFSANANSKNANTTLTEFNHPPDFGSDFNHDGKSANKLNGIDKATAKPNMPIAGAKIEPLVETCTSNVPIIGPVHENDTRTNVNAINRMLINPAVESAFASSFVVHEAGNVISNAPKNEIAKTTNNAKNNRLKMAFVDKLFSALAPKIRVIKIPIVT